MIQSVEDIHLGGLHWLGERFRRVRPTYALIVFWVLAASAIVIATVLVLWELRARGPASAAREIANLSQILSEQTARTVQAVDLILRGTEESLREREASHVPMEGKTIHALLRANVAGVPQIRSLSVINADGHITYTSREVPALDAAAGGQDYFAVHRDHPGRGLYIGRPEWNPLDGAQTIQMSRRLLGPNGEFRGVISAAVDLGYFEELYRLIKLGAGGAISLFLRDGTLIAREPHRDDLVGKSFADSPIFRALQAEPNAAAHRGSLLKTTDSAPLMISYRAIGDFPLVVAVAVSENTVLAGWRHQAMLTASGAAGVILILALAAVVLARELARDETLTEALRDSEARLHGIISSAMDAIITVDQNQRVVLFNSAAEKMFCCSSEHALGAPLDRFIPERYRGAHRRHMEYFGETGFTARAMGEQVEIIGRRADGEEFPVEVSVSQTTGGKKLYTAVVRDITKRRQAEEDLRKSHQQLRELSASLQSVREEERTRIARELHDELGQQLTGLRLDLSWMASRLRGEQTHILDKISDMKKRIDATVGTVRRIASELRPLMLDDLGLVAAAEWLVEEFSKQTGIQVSLDLQAGDSALGDSLATSIFRILQESLTNVARHAEATRIHISLTYRKERLVLKVQDNGKGMSPGAARKTRSFGLIGIRERAYMLGGEAHISSEPRTGTTIEVAIPVRSPVPEEHTE